MILTGPYSNRIGLASLFYLLFVSLASYGQWVKEDDTSKVWLRDGIYMSQSDFLTNSPSYQWVELSPEDWRYKDSLSRKGLLVELTGYTGYTGDLQINKRRFVVQDSTERVIASIKDIWGICIAGDAYRHILRAQDANFKKIEVIGTISYLSYSVLYEDPFYWSPDVMNTEPRFRNEQVDLVIDFEGGEIVRNNRTALEEILMRDEDLYQAYLLEKKKSKAVYQYIVRYNQRHPLDFKAIQAKSSQPDKQ